MMHARVLVHHEDVLYLEISAVKVFFTSIDDAKPVCFVRGVKGHTNIQGASSAGMCVTALSYTPSYDCYAAPSVRTRVCRTTGRYGSISTGISINFAI